MYVLVISAVAHLTMIEEAPGWKKKRLNCWCGALLSFALMVAASE